MMYLGIDAGKRGNAARMLDESEKTLVKIGFEATPEGLSELLSRIAEHTSDLTQVPVAIETKHGVLVQAFLNRGFTVYPVNPKNAERFREALNAAGKKSDEIDAEVLALFLKKFLKKLRPLSPESKIIGELRMLVEFRQTLVGDKVALENRLQAFLENYFPAAKNAFPGFSSDWVLRFIEQHPTPDKARLTPKKFERWFEKNQPRVKAETRKQAIEALTAPALHSRPDLVDVESRKMLMTLASLRNVVRQIKELQKRTKELFDSHEDADIFRSIPGAADTLEPWLLSLFGDDRDRFKNIDGLKAFAGVAPVGVSSGKDKKGKPKRHVRIRRACSKNFRQAMRLYAESTMKDRRCWARCYYYRRREAGDAHETALRKLANRWMNILFRLWKTRTLYSEHIHVQNMSKKRLGEPRLIEILAHA